MESPSPLMIRNRLSKCRSRRTFTIPNRLVFSHMRYNHVGATGGRSNRVSGANFLRNRVNRAFLFGRLNFGIAPKKFGDEGRDG
eukprot:1213058-Pleurochrysis_carterae.AAC.2